MIHFSDGEMIFQTHPVIFSGDGFVFSLLTAAVKIDYNRIRLIFCERWEVFRGTKFF